MNETTHVWQHQHGGTDYMSEAAWAQFKGGYGYADAIFNKNKTWAMLNPEQQGQLIQDAYSAGFFQTGKWNDPQRTQQQQVILINYMIQVLPQLCSGQGAT